MSGTQKPRTIVPSGHNGIFIFGAVGVLDHTFDGAEGKSGSAKGLKGELVRTEGTPYVKRPDL